MSQGKSTETKTEFDRCLAISRIARPCRFGRIKNIRKQIVLEGER